ncbi:hypothetical protein UCDDS831_g03072 [Diplodia seriata]|uniref:Uncharacterized protein n=1 Tax=Diplodia seriata TaxID=420778 RepID=A0A0G2EMK2_9PEZI|nr:hypothetical protein UCDDS831_g03072 [Diplodia seriata]
MTDKQPSLRQRILRGHRKSSDTGDISDSASDSSHSKKDLSNNAGSLSPAHPVAGPPSRSPSARVPKKLQKKRSNIESITPSPSLMPREEQHNTSLNNESAKPATSTVSRAEARRQERRQMKATDSGSTEVAKSRKVNNSDQNKDTLEPSRAKSSYEENGDGLSLMEVSPLSMHGEPAMSDLMDESNGENRKLGGPVLDAEIDSIDSPDYNDPNARGRPLANSRARAHARALRKRRTPSPISPPRDSENKTRDSPVSPLEGSSEGSSKDQDQKAPLLPHERMEPSTDSIAFSSEISSATTYLDSGRTGKLRKKPSLKSKIPTLKINTTDLTDATSSKHDKEDDGDEIHHDAVAAENALLETLRRITSKKQHTDTEIRAATDEVLRTAASVLDLGPRSPVLSQQLSPAPLLLPPAPEVPDVPTAHPNPDCDCCGGGRHRTTGRSLLEDVDEEDANDAKQQPKGGRHRQRQAPVGGERIKHPINVTYDRPIMLAAGVAQRGFRRWKCCRCHRYTHYENHVCSKLDCLHARCENRCETFEP